MSGCSPLLWRGAFLTENLQISWEFISQMTDQLGSWAALLEPMGIGHVGHWVVVDGVSEEGVIWIRDPVGLSYGIPFAEFIELWEYTIMVLEDKSP